MSKCNCNSFCCCCQDKTKINQKCSKHENTVEYLCTSQTCLQLLCEQCLEKHSSNHKKLAKSSTTIKPITELQNYYQKQIFNELSQIQEQQKKEAKNQFVKEFMTPTDKLHEYIDQFFYGSRKRRKNQLKQNFSQIKSDYDAHIFIKMIQQDHEYVLTPGFKQKYTNFLDKMVKILQSKVSD